MIYPEWQSEDESERSAIFGLSKIKSRIVRINTGNSDIDVHSNNGWRIPKCR